MAVPAPNLDNLALQARDAAAIAACRPGNSHRVPSEEMSGLIELSPQETVPPYADSGAELADQLLRVNRLLQGAVERFRAAHPPAERSGLDAIAIFDHEIDRFLDRHPPAMLPELGWAADRMRCERRAQASARQGLELPIDLVRQRFALAPLELDALLHCIAAELHPGYGRVFAYLHNDLTRQRPSVALLVDVLAANWAERIAVRRALGRHSPLFRCRLLAAARTGADHLTAELVLDPAVLDFVLGGSEPRDGSAPGDSPDLESLLLAPAERDSVGDTLRHLGRMLPDAIEPIIVVVSGAKGAGRRSVAGAICRHLHRRLRSAGKGATAAFLLAELPERLRDARLAGDAPAFYVPAADLPLCIDAIADAGCPLAFLLLESDEAPRLPAHAATGVIGIHLGPPDRDLRILAWRRALAAQRLDCGEQALASVAAVYPFTVGTIGASVRDAGLRARLVDPQASRLDLDRLAQGCRRQIHHQLDRLAQALPIRHGWDDLVLPADDLRRLREIADAVRNRDHVMERWGFERKMYAGPGVNAIFFGPSGTGKTMAASVVAGDLAMDIYRVDLSRVVSKYIGETERNLDALFDEARRSHALLFFDEAEALFGKRSEVKDAHDRYANIEVAYLLQRMEGFPGVAILATNLRKHMDNAFLRRLQFAVEFPLPGVAERLRIWRQVWPATAALGRDLDLPFIAARLELSGGHIRNVALTSAFLAAADGAPISMVHVVAAIRREFQKLGRHCAPDQLGPYAALLEVAR